MTTNHTDAFKILREISSENKRKEREKIVSLYKLVVYHTKEENDVKSTDIFYDINEIIIQDDRLKFCAVCKYQFTFFGRKKLQCPVCRRIVCKDCVKVRPIERGSKKTINLCKLCFKHLAERKMLKNFHKKKDIALQDKFVLWYNTIISLRLEILSIMPGLKGIIYTFAGNDKENIDVELLANMFELDTGAFHEMQQQATVHVEQLQLHFKNIQTRLKKKLLIYLIIIIMHTKNN